MHCRIQHSVNSPKCSAYYRWVVFFPSSLACRIKRQLSCLLGLALAYWASADVCDDIDDRRQPFIPLFFPPPHVRLLPPRYSHAINAGKYTFCKLHFLKRFYVLSFFLLLVLFRFSFSIKYPLSLNDVY